MISCGELPSFGVQPCLILGSGRSPGGGHGNPLQHSCLENPMDREAWWATIHGAAKSQAWLNQLSTHAGSHFASWFNSKLEPSNSWFSALWPLYLWWPNIREFWVAHSEGLKWKCEYLHLHSKMKLKWIVTTLHSWLPFGFALWPELHSLLYTNHTHVHTLPRQDLLICTPAVQLCSDIKLHFEILLVKMYPTLQPFISVIHLPDSIRTL